ncbi:Autotransporter adhesin SadA [Pseudomonas fluorescens]|uniref:Autotransporter adhesin SadA n=1 Tax=Pseudomonas fluorescens TaxID=294 RepID=A0A5E6Z8S5_PSEFL|nr:Autotransporter adhesin SadA [Pseudomonas fluorescens]
MLIGQVVAAPPTMGPTDGSGTFSSVLGCNASGGGQHAVSVFGTYASAVGEAGSAFGFYSLAGKWASGFGLSSTATGIGSTALGFGARAISTNAVAIGGAGGNGVTALTVANSTTASGAGSIAIGSNTLRGAQAAGTDAIAIGGQSTASFSSGIAIGRGSTSAGAFGLAAGDGASASTNGIAIGTGAIATGTSSISIGLGNNVSGNNSGAIGDPSTVTGANSYSLGNNNSVASNNAFALGNNITIPTGLDGSVVLGNDSTVSASVPTAGDTINGVTYNYAGATPVVGGVVSVGSAGGERQITNVAAGQVSSASTDAVNGSQLFATNTSVNSLGTTVNNIVNNGAGIKYFHSSSILADSLASGTDSVAVGPAATASASNAMALGNGATATIADSVALGSGATTAAAVASTGDTINGTAYTYAGGAPIGVLSLGSAGSERQITNVAAGQVSSASTDAVNGSQLFATNTSVNGLGTTVNNIVNNGAGIKYFHTSSILADSLASGTDSVAVGPAATASASNAMALGNGATATIADSVALGSGATTAAAVASTGDTINGTAYTYAGGAPIGVLSLGSVGSERQITNVAAGQVSSASTDAVNGSQLFATNTSVNGLGTTVNNIVNNGTGIKYFHTSSILADSLASGTDSVAVGPAATASASNAMALGNGATATIADSVALGSGATTTAAIANLGNTINGTVYTYAGGAPIGVLSVGSVGSERQITNVAAGQVSSTSTDAVNGSQLFATNTAVDVLGVSVNNIVNNGAGIKYFHSNSSLADSTATGIDSVAIGPQAVAVGAQSVALGTGAAANHDGSVALGSSAVTTVGAQSGYTAYGLSAAQNSVGEVGVGTALGDRKITGVAAGSALNDAVNVEQLTAVGNQVAQNTTNISNLDGRVTNLEGDILNVSGGITSVVNRVTQVESNVTNLQSGKDGMFQVNNTSAASKPSVTGTNAIAAGPGAVASGNNSAAIGTNAKASGTNSVAVGHDASATGNNSVALGANSVGTRDNSVSVGAVGSERQITNVAAATEGTDAVNFDQLNKSVTNITNNTTAYTDQRFSELKRDLKKQDNTLSAGIAGAMAMASLPQPYSPGASMTSIAVANYRGQSALSFGISRISDNGRWVGKLQASTSTQGDTGVGLGIGYQW